MTNGLGDRGVASDRQLVTVDVRNGVATIVIDRPEVRNAVDRATAAAIAAALDEVDAREDVSAAVLTGRGPVFSAGMDLKAFNKTGERPIVEGRGAFGICERATAKPLIAAVDGAALGGGFEIALACDMIVASTRATFGLPEVRRGLVAAAGGVVRLPRVLPRALALEMIVTGAPISAQIAFDRGLVNHITEPEQAVAAALELATTIAQNAPLAVVTAKQLAIESADWSQTEWPTLQAPLTNKVRESADAAEGARAFVEKRAPQWSGH